MGYTVRLQGPQWYVLRGAAVTLRRRSPGHLPATTRTTDDGPSLLSRSPVVRIAAPCRADRRGLRERSRRRPIAGTERLLAVMRDALKLSVCTGRRNIGWHKAPPTMIAPTEQTWRCGGSRRSKCSWLRRSCASIAKRRFVWCAKQQSGRKPTGEGAPARLATLGGPATGGMPDQSSGLVIPRSAPDGQSA